MDSVLIQLQINAMVAQKALQDAQLARQQKQYDARLASLQADLAKAKAAEAEQPAPQG